MNTMEIISEIKKVTTLNDLSMISRVVHEQMKQADRFAIFSFRPGDLVEFTSRKTGTCQGTVKKVNRSKMLVDCGSGIKWNVPANMCKKLNE
jgi:uncharacterized protein (DUF2235 family)